jgi:putative DNA primase/helicase
MTATEFLSRLDHVRPIKGGWQARCPAHPDKKPSLSITEKDGKTLVKCHAGCETGAILAALELKMSDLYRASSRSEASRRIAATYDYTDEQGKLLFQVVRFEPKGFQQRRPDGDGGWTWSLDGVRRVLFNLPAVMKAGAVLICEGEKDCLTAQTLGLPATCNPCGAGKWRAEYSESLRGKRVVIICDSDSPGVAHGKEVARSIIGVAASVCLIEALPQSKDLTEWVEKGGTGRELTALVGRTRELTAEDAVKWQSTKPANGFTLTRLGDLLKRPDTPVDYVWGGCLVAGTVSAVVSKPKVGKSTLARNLCLAVSRGDDFLELPTKQGECIYLALEEREEDVRNDFRAMGADGSEPISVHAAAAPADGIRALCDLVEERRPRLVVIDPLFRLARVRDEKAYAETYSALGPLIDAARESGTRVMFVHHSGKGLKADAVDSPLGSTAIAGAVATLIVLKRTEAYRTMETRQRTGQDMAETVMQFDPQAKRLSIGGTREQAETDTLSEEIAEFLRSTAESRTEPDITEAVEGKTKFVRRALRRLVEQGRVSREGGGKRGDPYRYQFSFSCSHYNAGTREQETENTPDARINTERNLVPTSERKAFLVPDIEDAPNTAFPPVENLPESATDASGEERL